MDLESAIKRPIAEARQADDRIQRWAWIPEERRFLRNVKYFKDSDTALLEFSDEPVDETKEISQNVFIDLDRHGNLVSMTIEHAAQVASFPNVNLQGTASGVA